MSSTLPPDDDVPRPRLRLRRKTPIAAAPVAPKAVVPAKRAGADRTVDALHQLGRALRAGTITVDGSLFRQVGSNPAMRAGLVAAQELQVNAAILRSQEDTASEGHGAAPRITRETTLGVDLGTELPGYTTAAQAHRAGWNSLRVLWDSLRASDGYHRGGYTGNGRGTAIETRADSQPPVAEASSVAAIQRELTRMYANGGRRFSQIRIVSAVDAPDRWGDYLDDEDDPGVAGVLHYMAESIATHLAPDGYLDIVQTVRLLLTPMREVLFVAIYTHRNTQGPDVRHSGVILPMRDVVNSTHFTDFQVMGELQEVMEQTLHRMMNFDRFLSP